MSDKPIVVEFHFQVRQVKTMVDKTFNITLNLPEYAADAASEIMRRVDAAGTAALIFEPILQVDTIKNNGKWKL